MEIDVRCIISSGWKGHNDESMYLVSTPGGNRCIIIIQRRWLRYKVNLHVMHS